MRKLLIVMVAAVQAACGKPAPFESADSLATNPERLKELRAKCKEDRARTGEAQCNAVAEATRRRFFGSGGPKHTPVAPAPATSASAPKD
jgi:conjugative transfer region protein TrbK